MITKIVKMIDGRRTVVATAQVVEQGKTFTGSIDLSLMPASLRQKFEAYEEIVNGQMFSLLDDIEEQISTMLPKVEFNEEYEAAVEDLQIYPSTRRISFVLVNESAQSTAKTAMIA